MSFSDIQFAYGPFVPHWVVKQYIENYFSTHRTDSLLVLRTTVEDVTKLPNTSTGLDRWSLTLRRYDPVTQVDVWWKEEYDAVIFANGHYSVPYVSIKLYIPVPRMLTLFRPGPQSRWVRGVYTKVPRTSYPLQILPIPSQLQR